MDKKKCYDNYPIGFVIGANILQFFIYILGAYLVYLLGIVWLFLYIIYIIILEIRLLRISCIHCYYYGKRCAFGRGILCSVFFKKGESHKFIDKKIGWLDVIPDFLVSLIPLIIGIGLLINHFTLFLLIIVGMLIVLAFPINGFLRGSLACKYCKQKEIGCPAEQFFNKDKKINK